MSLISPDERAAILARAYPDQPPSEDGGCEGLSVGWNGRRMRGWAAVAVGMCIVLIVLATLPVLVIVHIVLRIGGRRGFAYREAEEHGGHRYVWHLDAAAFNRRYPG